MVWFQVGQILDAIETSGREDDTLVILSSDHGGLEFQHGRAADSDILIPMFIKGEAQVTIGQSLWLCRKISWMYCQLRQNARHSWTQFLKNSPAQLLLDFHILSSVKFSGKE